MPENKPEDAEKIKVDSISSKKQSNKDIIPKINLKVERNKRINREEKIIHFGNLSLIFIIYFLSAISITVYILHMIGILSFLDKDQIKGLTYFFAGGSIISVAIDNIRKKIK